MSSNNKAPASWQEAIKFMGKCPMCGANYSVKQAKLFAQKDQANLVHLSCGSCQGNFIALIIVLGQGISTLGMVSDWDFDDAGRLHSLAPISIDELIEARHFFNQEILQIT